MQNAAIIIGILQNSACQENRVYHANAPFLLIFNRTHDPGTAREKFSRLLAIERWEMADGLSFIFLANHFLSMCDVLMERSWIKTCVKVQFTPSLLTQQQTATKRELVCSWSKLTSTFFHPVKKFGAVFCSSRTHCWPHLLCWSYQWLMAGCWLQELLRQCGSSSQQIASQMFQTLGRWSHALSFSNAPHLEHLWRILLISTVFWVDSRILFQRKYNLQYDKLYV